MDIRKLKIQNFGSYANAELALENLGLVLIEGENRDAGGSNGSGKSSTLNAICWALYGKTVSGRKGDDVVRYGHKDCYVGLDVELGGKTLLVDRFRNHVNHGNNLMVSYDFEDLTQGTNRATQEVLEKLVGIDYQTFVSVVLFPQGATGIAGLTGNDQRHIFEQILGLEKFAKAEAKVKEWVAADKKRVEEVRQEIKVVDSALTEKLNHIRQLEQLDEEWEATKDEKLQYAKDYCLNVEQKKPTGLDELYAERDELLKRLEALREDDTLTVYREAQNAVHTLTAKLNELRRQSFVKRVEFDPEERLRQQQDCPSCGQILPEQARLKLLSKFQEELGAIQASNAEIEHARLTNLLEQDQAAEQIKHYGNVIQAAEKQAAKADEVQEQIRVAERRIQEGEWNLKQWESELAQARKKVEEAETQTNPYAELLTNSKEQLDFLKEDIRTKESRLEPMLVNLRQLEFWVKAFGGKGVKQLLFSTVTPFLNERANLYMRELTNGTARVKINTQRELKSGALRDELSFQVVYPGTDSTYEAKSGGERRRADIAIQFAMADLATARSRTPVGFAILDEIFDNLDVQGSEQVVDLLIQHVVPARKTVLVISHNDSLKTLFEQRLKVVKESGVSRVEA